MNLLFLGIDDAIWVALIISAAGAVIGQLIVPKPKVEDQRPRGLGDLNFPTADAARPVPVIFGTVRIDAPNVVWYGDLRTRAIKDKIKNGGLFSGSKHVTVGFNYFIGIQFALCRGPVDPELLQVYIGDRVAYDGPFPTAQTTIQIHKFFGDPAAGGAGGIDGKFTAYRGTDDQAANAYLSTFQQSAVGTLRTPRYVGTCHLVWEGGYLGNTPSAPPWSFVVSRFPNGLGLLQPFVIGEPFGTRTFRMANPACVVYEILTDQEWGRNLPASRIDLDSFRAAAETLNTERNGFCGVIDRSTRIDDLLAAITRQIDGFLIDNPVTGKFELRLARADYNVATIPELTRDINAIEVERFARSTLTGTVNQLRVRFIDPSQDFTDQEATEQDIANAMLQGAVDVTTGTNVAATMTFPYVFSKQLARSIASRELRKMSLPLARATVRVTRALWSVLPGDVLAFTDDLRGIVKLPMRVMRVTHGAPGDDDVTIDMVQDVFSFEASDFGTTPDTKWAIDDSLLPFDEVFVDECPRAIARRQSEVGVNFPGALIYVGARRKGAEVGFKIMMRENGTSDPFLEDGEVNGHVFVATLSADLGIGSVSGNTITIVAANAADQLAILAALPALVDARDAGINLKNLICIARFSGGVPIHREYGFVTSAAAGSGLNVVLSGVFRGVLDSVQSTYSVGDTKVFVLAGTGVNDSFLSVPGDFETFDVKLLPFSRRGLVPEASVAAFAMNFFHRSNAPYAPGQVSLNGVAQDTIDISLEGSGTGDGVGIGVAAIRRDFRTDDEVKALTVDAATLHPDFPTVNNTLHNYTLKKTTVGQPTIQTQQTAAASVVFTRNDILIAFDGAIPTSLLFLITAEHTIQGGTVLSGYAAGWTFTVVSSLTGLVNMGALDQTEISNVYTADGSGTYNFTLNQVVPAGKKVEARVNGGAFFDLITAGNLSGSIPGIVTNDTIEIRHTIDNAGFKTFCMVDRASVNKAYAVIYKA